MTDNQNQQNKPLSRQQRHYLRHGDRIKKALRIQRRKIKESKTKIEETLAKPRKSIFLSKIVQHVAQLSEQLTFEKLCLAILVVSCTAFMIWQSMETLEATEGHGAIYKATLCEFVLIAASMLGASRGWYRAVRALVLLGVCGITLLNALGGPLLSFSREHSGFTSRQKQIEILGHSVAEKRDLMNRYLAYDRVSKAQKIEKEISALTTELRQAEKEVGEDRSQVAIVIGFAIAVLLRVTVMLANMLFANHLGIAIREGKRREKPNSGRPQLILVHG